MDELERLRQENEELKKTVEVLRKKLRECNQKVTAHNAAEARRWRQQSDYLPYDDDDRR